MLIQISAGLGQVAVYGLKREGGGKVHRGELVADPVFLFECGSESMIQMFFNILLTKYVLVSANIP